MKLYLAGEGHWRNFSCSDLARCNRLKSFAYASSNSIDNPRLYKSFMLDSGAFSFAYGKKTPSVVNWFEYLEQYAQYINDNDVQLFFELDIDKLVGYEEVCKLRKALEDKTNKQCIPVWHLTRGKDDWLRTCSEYSYVALGGLAAKELPSPEKVIPWFTRTAHARDCKVHGLGYSKITALQSVEFDSVDSTTWLYGLIAGHLFQYRGGYNMTKILPEPGYRMEIRKTAVHNFHQWLQFAEFLEEHHE